jgi:serine/threonine-protein kinase
MLYEMLAGEPPFTAKNAMALMARHAMEAVPSIRIVRNTVPEEVEDTIYAAMAKSPADRLQTAEEFAEMLGMPLGATATRRASIRATASRRVPTMAHRTMMLEQPWWKKPWAIAAGLVVLLGGAFAAWQLGSGGSGPPVVGVDGLDPKQVAVLYFEDQSREQDLGFLTNGVTEELIQRLATVQGLGVISKGGVEAWRGATVGDDSVARALRAGTIVRGAIDRDGQNLRVSLRLVDGNSGVDFERTSLTEPEADLIQIRDSVALTVANLIRNRLGQEIRLRDQQRSTKSVQAWSLVQRAEQLRKSGEAAAAVGDSVSRIQYERDMTSADSILALAEGLDASWAEPVVLRSLVAYKRSRLSGRDQVEIQRWVDLGLGHANRALEMDVTNADALEHRGNLKYWSWLIGLEPDPVKAAALLEEAKTDLEKATEYNPVQAGAWASLSHLYNQTGSGVDVNLAARRALEADAFLSNADVILNRLFLSSYDLEQLPDASRWCDEVRRRFPDSFNAPRCELFMLTTRAREPDAARAWRLADSVTQRSPRPAYYELNSKMLVAAVLARAGLTDSAAALVERSKGDAEISPTRDLNLFGAFVYRLLGDTDKAVDMLKVYFAANERMRATYAQEPGWWFRDIASDPKYRQLVGGP